MSSVSGTLLDASSKQPLVGIVITALDGNGNVIQGVGDITDTDGGYYIDSDLLDNPGVSLSVDDPNQVYGQLFGEPGIFEGENTMFKLDTVSYKIPMWVWILVIILVISGVTGYLAKLKKLL